jgi:hypothetical protein
MATFAYPAGVSSSSQTSQVSLSYSGKIIQVTPQRTSTIPFILAYQRRWGTQLTYLFGEKQNTSSVNSQVISAVVGVISSTASDSITPINFSGSTAGSVLVPITPSTNNNVIFNGDLKDNIGYEVLTSPANRELTFGVITSDKSLQLIIYNKRLDSITITSHTIPEHFGCEISGLAIGASIPPLGQATINIKAKLLSGDSEIADFCPIYFDKVTIWVYVTITRQPVVIYSLFPDRGSYNESYTYRTNIFESTSGKEKRVSTMTKAKIKSNYKLTASSASMASFFENTVYSGLYSEMYQPLWAFSSKTTAQVSSSTTVPCDTYNDIFIPGNYVCIYTTELEVTLARIVSVTPSSLVLLKPVSCAQGTWIMPVALMIPSKSTSTSYNSSSGQSHNISLQEY